MSDTTKAESELDIKAWSDIFRPIGPADDVVVSLEKLDEYITQAKKDLLAEVREKMYESHGSCRYASLAAIDKIEEKL